MPNLYDSLSVAIPWSFHPNELLANDICIWLFCIRRRRDIWTWLMVWLAICSMKSGKLLSSSGILHPPLKYVILLTTNFSVVSQSLLQILPSFLLLHLVFYHLLLGILLPPWDRHPPDLSLGEQNRCQRNWIHCEYNSQRSMLSHESSRLRGCGLSLFSLLHVDVILLAYTHSDLAHLLQARLVLEALTLFGATMYVFLSLKEIYHQGYKTFYQTLVNEFLNHL